MQSSQRADRADRNAVRTFGDPLLVSTNLLLALQVASASYEELEYGQTWSRAMGQLASTPAKPTMQY